MFARPNKSFFFLLIFVLDISYSVAQWLPSKGVEGGYCFSVLDSDTNVLLAESNHIYISDLEAPWQLVGDLTGKMFRSGDCILTYAVMHNMYRSFDNGFNWEAVPEYLSPRSACAIDTVVFVEYYYNYIARSFDYLNTYELITGLPELDNPLVLSYDSLLIVYDDCNTKMYQSIDVGYEWDSITVSGLPFSPYNTSDIYCYKNTIWISGAYGVYYLNPDRSGWIKTNNGLSDNNLVYSFFKWNDELYCGTANQGLCRFHEADSAWLSIAGTPTKVLEMVEFNEKLLIASSYGPFLLDTSGNWTRHADQLFHRTIDYLSEYQDTLFICASNEVYRSSDKGDSFELISDIAAHQFMVTDSFYYAISNTDVMVSANYGINWDTITGDLLRNIYRFAVTPKYYFVSSSDGLFRSPIDSIYWEKLENGINSAYIYYFAALDSVVIAEDFYGDFIAISRDHGSSFDTLFSIEGDQTPKIQNVDQKFTILTGSVLKISDDLGNSWKTLELDDPHSNIRCIDIDGETIIVSGSANVISPMLKISLDGGISWTELSGGLPFNGYPLIAPVHLLNDRVIAGSKKNSLWYRDDILTSMPERKNHYVNPNSIDIYPNPSAGLLNISFQETPVHAQYEVYGLNGGLIAKGEITSTDQMIFIEDLKPGVYILRVLEEEQVFSEKIIKY